MSASEAMQRACAAVGSQSALAAAIGKKQAHIWHWIQTGSVPPEHCAAIELAAGGKVTRKELRPDDWERIWPELARRVAA